MPPNPSDLVPSEQMEAMLIALRDQFNHVVIDSPAGDSFFRCPSLVTAVRRSGIWWGVMA